ncbi:helix-turn-helix domain-containing protein [Marinobacterium mangrovicola]|uniref:helix-turn-helix domain-containing protein n=1 Tax=Marinobacterium mangrovicola TaxID=1476959 RepID=UPI001FB3E9E2|nr:helix-turn-helix domain-containing protein [Marinobacterium mangrovicola]
MAIKDLSPKNLEKARVRAVQLRISGYTLAETSAQTGLSVPTITKVFKAFESGGWAAIKPAPRGRKAGEGSGLSAEQQQQLRERLLEPPVTGLWSREAVATEVARLLGVQVSERAISRLLDEWHLDCPALKVRKPKGVRNTPAHWYRHEYEPLLAWGEQHQASLLLAFCRPARRSPDTFQLSLQTSLRKQLWLESSHWPTESWLIQVLERLIAQKKTPLALCLAGLDLRRADRLWAWLNEHETQIKLIAVPPEVELRSS